MSAQHPAALWKRLYKEKTCSGAGEVVQWGEHSPFKLEDKSLNPQSSSGSRVVHVRNWSTSVTRGEVEAGESVDALGPASLAGLCSGRQETLSPSARSGPTPKVVF